MEKSCADFGIIAFLVLATALGIAESEYVPAQERPAWRVWGAPIGMKQYWRVFGPDLRPVNWHSSALIQFRDGTVKNYEFPRPDKMTLGEAYAKSPETVFFFEIMPNVHNKKMLPAVARFIARANNDPTNPPANVTFVFHSAVIPPPDQSKWTYRDRLPQHTATQTYFVYQVTKEDLAENK